VAKRYLHKKSSGFVVKYLATFAANILFLLSETNHTEQNFTFPKAEHLKSKKAIEELFKAGRSFFVHPYKVFYSVAPISKVMGEENKAFIPEYPIQAGFAVSTRNFKHAVDRNRIKRLGREAYRMNKHILLNAMKDKDLLIHLFFVYTDRTLPTFKLVQQKMVLSLHKMVSMAEKSLNAPISNIAK